METNRFYYTHLLKKPYPEQLFAGVRTGRRP
jgi:hypothetical protein